MIYYSRFTDIDDQQYMVRFTVDDSDDRQRTQEFELADNPFTTDMEVTQGNLYKPGRYQTATVRILTNGLTDYMFDLYSPKAQQVKVELYKGNDIEWVGYVEPSLYDIGFVYKNEELEVNCLDGLSTLQYLRYKPIGTEKGVYTITDILKHILQQCNCYNYVHVQNNLFVTTGDSEVYENIFDKVKISEQIFFDADGREEKDDTYKTALEKIMTFFGFSIMAEKGDVYVLDYDGIKHGEDMYTIYDLSDDLSPTVTGETYTYDITANSYASDQSRLSLDKVYQKASVEDKFYNVDELLPDIWDKANRVYICPDNLQVKPWMQAQVKGNTSKDSNMTWCYYRVYRNKLYNFYAYDESDNQIDLDTYIAVRNFLDNYVDCSDWDDEEFYINKYEHYWPELIPPDIMRVSGQCAVLVDYYNYDGLAYKYPDLLDGKIIMPYFQASKALVLCVNQKQLNRPKSTRKLFELNPTYKKPVILGGDQMYLVIEGSAIYEDKYDRFGYDSNHTRRDDSWRDEDAYLPCKLKYGNRYWNGQTWQSGDTLFPLYLWKEDHSHYIGQEMKVKNNVPYQWQMNVDGTAIPFPDSILDDEAFSFAIYTPRELNSNYLTCSVWIKDFKISVHVVGEEGEESSDTTKSLYYNIDNSIFSDIDLNNVEEFPTVNFDITTYDGKKAAYSCPCIFNALGNHYLKEIYNKSNGESLIAEKMLIKRIVDQYSTPTEILNLNLVERLPMRTLVGEDMTDKDYIIDSISSDYKYKSHNTILIAKK